MTPARSQSGSHVGQVFNLRADLQSASRRSNNSLGPQATQVDTMAPLPNPARWHRLQPVGATSAPPVAYSSERTPAHVGPGLPPRRRASARRVRERANAAPQVEIRFRAEVHA